MESIPGSAVPGWDGEAVRVVEHYWHVPRCAAGHSRSKAGQQIGRSSAVGAKSGTRTPPEYRPTRCSSCWGLMSAEVRFAQLLGTNLLPRVLFYCLLSV